MFLKYYLNAVFLCLYFLENVTIGKSLSKDEFETQKNQGAFYEESFIEYIFPDSYTIPSETMQTVTYRTIEDILFGEDNEDYKILKRHIEAGHTMKTLTFTIYDDNMREAAVALFRILQAAPKTNIWHIKRWADANLNDDIVNYAMRVASLHRTDGVIEIYDSAYTDKANYFVNSETLNKALKFKWRNGSFSSEESQVYQVFKNGDFFVINSNYSGWNEWDENCEANLDYFREDTFLNSYYYGVHLKYPFWMSNDELLAFDSRYTESIYYIHKQLSARYNLEKEHLTKRDFSNDLKSCNHFNPNLSYDNGIPFPTRSAVRMEWNDEFSRIKAIDIAIKECISRGLIFMDNGAKVDLTEDNYVDLLIKLIRANYESNHTAKYVRAMFGNGGKGYPTDRYNPAPSVMHHPQTTLRDPLYWRMFQYLLNYFTDFSNTLKPYDFSNYKYEDINIVNVSCSEITTYFEYYSFVLNDIVSQIDVYKQPPYLSYTARKKLLTHSPFTIEFTVDSKVNKTCEVKLFLGPQCHGPNCWDNYSRYYELDSFYYEFEPGLNLIKRSSKSFEGFSFQLSYNFDLRAPLLNTYEMPQYLHIPHGLKEGLNLTLFVFIFPNIETNTIRLSEPIGFPFHRQVLINSTVASNYKFHNISIYHKEKFSIGANIIEDYFSPHLN